MNSEPQVSHEWERPDEIASYQAEQLRKRGKIYGPILSLSVVIIEILLLVPAYLLLKRVTPEYDSWPFILLFFAGLLMTAISLFFLYFLYPMLTRNYRYSYAITPKGICFQCRDNPATTQRWAKFRGYWLSQHEHFPDLTVLYILRKRKQPFPLVLPRGQDPQPIIDTINQHLSLIANPLPFQKITLLKRQHILLWLFTFGFSALMPVFLAQFDCPLLYPFGLVALFYFGPGTILLLITFRKRFLLNYYLHMSALHYNLLSILLSLLSMLLFVLFQISKTI